MTMMDETTDTAARIAALQMVDQMLSQAKAMSEAMGDDAFLRGLLEAMGRVERTDFEILGDPVQSISDQSWSRDSQRFFGACFIRLNAALPDLIPAHATLRIAVVKLIEALPDLLKVLRIDVKQQGFEKLQALGSAQQRAEERLQQSMDVFQGNDTFSESRQQIMRSLNSPLVRSLIVSFLPPSSGVNSVESLLKAGQRYFDASPAEKLIAFQQAQRTADAVLERVSEEPSHYGLGFVRPLAERLKQVIAADYKSSPYSKPAAIAVEAIDKKYPFGVESAQIGLAFLISNTSEGHARDVRVTLETEDRLRVIHKSRDLGDLQPCERFGEVEFTCEVATADAAPLIATVRSQWFNADGSEDQAEVIIELEAQQRDIPWSELAARDPYSIEPVEDASELVGRAELLAELENRLRAKNVGSFWIYGQKRVGKTSIARILKARLDEHAIVVYLDAGDYITQEPLSTIQRLGRKLCEAIQRLDPRFRHLDIPEFADGFSQLDDFLQSTRDIDPGARIIFILDEFDELPIDVYRRGGIGDAFFLTLRSLSGKPNLGFVLVGGEKMEFILSSQGDVLNKFAPLRVDYFSRESHWSDFQELIRKPIAPWAIVTDRAVVEVYEASAGNPFFAKLVCNELFRDMRKRSDAYVTEREMARACRVAIAAAGSNQFQHFWEDGIFEISGDRIEEVSMLRRRVLLAISDILRQGDAANADAIVAKAGDYGLQESDVRRELDEFLRRKVLIKDRAGRFSCKVGLFQEWLKDRGPRKIVTSFTDHDAILERKRRDEDARISPEEIASLVGRWGIYKGKEVGGERVRSWLNQFGAPTDQRLMLSILEGVRFYSAAAVRSKLSEAHASVIRELASRGIVRKDREMRGQKRSDNILISYIGQAGKSGPQYVRIYSDENRIFYDRAVEPHRLPKALREVGDVHGLVIVDDFIGTGTQAIEGLSALIDSCGEILQSRGITMFFTAVSGFAAAGERVQTALRGSEVDVQLRLCDPLGDSDRCFSESSTIFADPGSREKAKAIALSHGTKLEKRQPLGYGGCEAAVVFEYNTPNNTLPVLWKDVDGWIPLFPR